MRLFICLSLLMLNAAVANAGELKQLNCNASNSLGTAKMTFDAQSNVITSVINAGAMTIKYSVDDVYAESETGDRAATEILMEDPDGKLFFILLDRDLAESHGVQRSPGTFYFRPENGAVFGEPSFLGWGGNAGGVGFDRQPVATVNCTIEMKQ